MQVVGVKAQNALAGVQRNLREGDFVFVRVLKDLGGKNYSVSFLGGRFLVQSQKPLLAGETFRARVSFDGTKILLSPAESAGGGAASPSAGVSSFLQSLGLADGGMGARLFQFLVQSGAKIDGALMQKAARLSKRFKGREAAAAEAALALEEKGIESDSAALEELLDLLGEGGSDDGARRDADSSAERGENGAADESARQDEKSDAGGQGMDKNASAGFGGQKASGGPARDENFWQGQEGGAGGQKSEALQAPRAVADKNSGGGLGAFFGRSASGGALAEQGAADEYGRIAAEVSRYFKGLFSEDFSGAAAFEEGEPQGGRAGENALQDENASAGLGGQKAEAGQAPRAVADKNLGGGLGAFFGRPASGGVLAEQGAGFLPLFNQRAGSALSGQRKGWTILPFEYEAGGAGESARQGEKSDAGGQGMDKNASAGLGGQKASGGPARGENFWQGQEGGAGGQKSEAGQAPRAVEDKNSAGGQKALAGSGSVRLYVDYEKKAAEKALVHFKSSSGNIFFAVYFGKDKAVRAVRAWAENEGVQEFIRDNIGALAALLGRDVRAEAVPYEARSPFGVEDAPLFGVEALA